MPTDSHTIAHSDCASEICRDFRRLNKDHETINDKSSRYSECNSLKTRSTHQAHLPSAMLHDAPRHWASRSGRRAYPPSTKVRRSAWDAVHGNQRLENQCKAEGDRDVELTDIVTGSPSSGGHARPFRPLHIEKSNPSIGVLQERYMYCSSATSDFYSYGSTFKKNECVSISDSDDSDSSTRPRSAPSWRQSLCEQRALSSDQNSPKHLRDATNTTYEDIGQSIRLVAEELRKCRYLSAKGGTASAESAVAEELLPITNASRDDRDKSVTVVCRDELHLPNDIATFEQLVCHPSLKKVFAAQHPSLQLCGIQRTALPIALKGFDALVTSVSSPEKTLCYIIPAISTALRYRQQTTSIGPSVIIVTPTRELCFQISAEVERYLFSGKELALRHLMLYSGSTEAIRRRLSRGFLPDIVIGCVGRLASLCNPRPLVASSGQLDISQVKLLILDEADMLLQQQPGSTFSSGPGLLLDIASALHMPHQTLLFSATQFCGPEPTIRQLVRLPFAVKVIGESQPDRCIAAQVTHSVKIVPPNANKCELVKQILTQSMHLGGAVVFCNSVANVTEVYEYLVQEKLPRVIQSHGSQPFSDRKETFLEYSRYSGTSDIILVTTDAYARGVHNEHFGLVVNYDPPRDWRNNIYIHRIGRCRQPRRADDQFIEAEGEAVTLCTPEQLPRFSANLIELLITYDLSHKIPDTLRDAVNLRKSILLPPKNS